MLRGSALATVDEAGRLKLPAGFRRIVEAAWGSRLFLTSLTGDCMSIYPLKVWEAKETLLMKAASQHPAVSRFVSRTSYFGAEAELDGQGRVLVPGVLRAAARMEGAVAVLGLLDRLEVWNDGLFQERLRAEPFTEADRQALAELGL